MNDYNDSEKGIYPQLPDQTGTTFRLNKSCEILTKLENEEKHYSVVKKKYKRVQTIFHKICLTSGALSLILSSSALAATLTGGIIFGIPLAGLAGLTSLLSIMSGSYQKKLRKKVLKHNKIIILTSSKISSIKDLISKAIQDHLISDSEFEIILKELDKYELMKQQIRNKFQIRGKKEGKSLPISNSYVNLLRKEIQEEWIKKLRLQPTAPPE